MTAQWSSFDYSSTQGIAEISLRIELLAERLWQLTKDTNVPVLEVGVGGGDITLMLAAHFRDVTCVELVQKNTDLVLSRLREHNLAHVKFICNEIETAKLSDNGYKYIILQNILEHLQDPVATLHYLAQYLYSDGTIHISVPLANSLHRWLGVEMGIISNPEEVAESDVLYGHHRVYTLTLLREHIKMAGLQVVYEKPFYLKPLPTSVLRSLPRETHLGLFELGERFPEFASYAYIEAMK